MRRSTLLLRPLLYLFLFSASAIRAADLDVDLPSLDRRYDQITWLATHNSYANPDEGIGIKIANQRHSITDQLNYGVRVINPDVWLVRQKLIGSFALGNCKCLFETYLGTSTKYQDKRLKDEPVVAVVAHGNEKPDGGVLEYCTPWKTFEAELIDIRKWVETHPNDVITIVLENKISEARQAYVTNAFVKSGLEKYMFYMTDFNTNVVAPEGREHGWHVGRYGFPTLKQLVDAGKTVVYAAPNRALQGDYEVGTVYGHESLDPDTWTDYRQGGWKPIDNFVRRTFSMAHMPDLPTGHNYHSINSYKKLNERWGDLRARWDRLPTSLWVDYYDFGDPATAFGIPGPAEYVNQMNAIWKSLPKITPTAQIAQTPSAYGWYNTDVDVTLSGDEEGHDIRAVTGVEFHGASQPYPTAARNYHLTDQLRHTVSFSVVGKLGNRSDIKLVDVFIDKTPPTITCTLEPATNTNGWYVTPVTAHFQCSDKLSGIASCPSDVILNQEGRNQSVSGTSRDKADNESTVTVTNINIDFTGPVIDATAKPTFLWPPNGKRPIVVVLGTMTDAGSGVDPATARYSVTDEYHEVEPCGRISLGRGGSFGIILHLEARRDGADKDGRRYVVHLNATDFAGHASEQTVTITVPHDEHRF